ncbi:MAG: hypothetical protein HQL41_09325 [Alphaproteobacteria bacterium]|nr:hypothetical protein [Alphaproteobacteria bacterium]
MSRLHTSFVLGYHGCDKKTGEAVLAEGGALSPSDEEYDWLGPGIYFWEADPKRAFEWAEWKAKRGGYETPFVIGAMSAHTRDEDHVLRYLDCAVIRRLHGAMDKAGEPFETVRGLFTEGNQLFPGSGFQEKTHVQIAVRSTGNIKGYFRVSSL